jgi:hypothetical protein
MRFIQTVRGNFISVNSIVEIKTSGRGDDQKYLVRTKYEGPIEIYSSDYETLTETIGRHLGCAPAQPGWYIVSLWRDSDAKNVSMWKEPITAWRIDIDGQSHPVTCDDASYSAILAPDGTVREPSSSVYESMDEYLAHWERDHPSKSDANAVLSEASSS